MIKNADINFEISEEDMNFLNNLETNCKDPFESTLI